MDHFFCRSNGQTFCCANRFLLSMSFMSTQDMNLDADKLCACPMLNKGSHISVHIQKSKYSGADNVASQVNLASLLPAEAWTSFLALFFHFLMRQKGTTVSSSVSLCHEALKRHQLPGLCCKSVRSLLDDRLQCEVVCLRACAYPPASCADIRCGATSWQMPVFVLSRILLLAVP